MVPDTRYARLGGLSIAYQVWGEGEVDIVFASGPAGQVDLMWDVAPVARVYERLGSFARVCAFDRRGTGLSDPAEGPPTLEQHMEDLAAVIDATGFDRPSVLGSSEAGRMVLLYAATYPERIRSVVLSGTTSRGAAVMVPEVEAAMRQLIDQNWGSGGLLEFFAPSHAADPEVRQRFGRVERSAVSPGMAQRLVTLSAQMDVRAILPAVKVPVLVVHREQDRFAPIEEARELAAALPNGRLIEFPGIDNALWAGDNAAILDAIEEFLTGHTPHREPDRVLASVLFTDVVNSTARAAEVGDAAWRDLLDHHHRTVRRELARHRGTEVKTVGDGFVATFDGPARAVRAARDLIRAVRDEVGLHVRAGVHTGEIELLDGDIAGVAVHIAARVAGEAGAGELLVSRTVRDLVVGSELVFEDRGTHALRGVPDEWQLLALAG